MPVNALHIWRQLADECGSALSFYSEHRLSKLRILNLGSTNFDKKCIDSAEEKPHYKVDYYVSECGTMEQHLKQNLEVFRHYLKKIPARLLLVDFGCGPMTAGIAMAEIASEQDPQYKNHICYVGIDASQNMVDKARYINEQHELFLPKAFRIIKSTEFKTSQIPHPFRSSRAAILCLSFVLAPKTLQPKNKNEHTLGQDWKKYVEKQSKCNEMKIVYLNPFDEKFHPKWQELKNIFKNDDEDIFDYTTPKHYKIPGGRNGIYLSIIDGERK